MKTKRRLNSVDFGYFLLISLVLVLFLFSSIGVSDPDGAKHVLKSNGYSSVSITGWKFFGCGDDDFFHTRFSAISPNGQRVTGVVCKGFFKANTIRFD